MRKGFAAFVLTAILVCCVAALAACGDKRTAEKSVSGVSVLTEPTKTEYLKDEPFDISGGKISVAYSDGSSMTLDMTSEMYDSADTSSYGEKKLTLTFEAEDNAYTLEIGYTVIFSAASNAFVKQCRDLPMLNEVEVSDAEDVMAAFDAYDALEETEKAYLAEHEPQAREKLAKLEERILSGFLDAAKARTEEYRELLNVSNYTEENLTALDGLLNAFSSQAFQALRAASAAEAKLYEDVEKIAKCTDDPAYTLEEHRANSAEALRAMLSVNVYTVKNNGITGSVIETKSLNYAAADAYSAQAEALIAPLLSASDADGVDAAYRTAVAGIRGLYLEAFAQDAVQNLAELLNGWKDTMREQLDRWDKDTISLIGQFSEINVDYLDDNRWWIPMPYRIDVLLDSVAAKLESAVSIRQINEFYGVYAYEILRATMQRNLEMFYAIERNLNDVYDTGDALYWGNIAGYWGSSAAQSFVYDGIVDEYVGQTFGTSDANPYRFAAKLYQEGQRGKTIGELVEKYEELLAAIIPEPVRVAKVEITKQPDQTVYKDGDTFSVAGGEILVTYNNTRTEIVAMTDEMYDAADVDLATGGSKTLTLTFTVNGEEQTVTLNYSVISDAAFSELIAKINGLPAASAATAENVADVMACLALYEQLSEEQRGEFSGQYAAEEAKLAEVQAALVSAYAGEAMRQAEFAWETVNYFDYSEENRALLNVKLDALKAAVAAAPTFAAADALFVAYRAEIASVPTLSATDLDLAAFKANTKLSAERIAEVRLYAVTANGPAGSGIALQTVSLKNAAGVAAALNTLHIAVDAAADLGGVADAYAAGVRAVYDAVVAEYRIAAEENVKALVAALRDTVKGIWEKDGFAGDTNLPVDYMVDAWEYLWWTPEPFRVSTVYAKISVGGGASKGEVYAHYEAAYIEMLRAVLYRNIYTVFQYNLRQDASVENHRWSVLSAFNGAAGANPFPYDGTIAEYRGTNITVEFRLWLWGFKPGEKQTTVAGLMEKYNYDMNTLLLQQE